MELHHRQHAVVVVLQLQDGSERVYTQLVEIFLANILVPAMPTVMPSFETAIKVVFQIPKFLSTLVACFPAPACVCTSGVSVKGFGEYP